MERKQKVRVFVANRNIGQIKFTTLCFFLSIFFLHSSCLKDQFYTFNFSIFNESVHSPLFVRKIIKIGRFALQAAILHECQNYLGGRGGLGG